MISVVKGVSGTILATEMSTHPDRVQIGPSGYLMPGNGRVLNTLIAMKPLDQSLPDFLRGLAGGIRENKKEVIKHKRINKCCAAERSTGRKTA